MEKSLVEIPLDYHICQVILTVAVPYYSEPPEQVEAMLYIKIDEDAMLLGSKETLLTIAPI